VLSAKTSTSRNWSAEMALEFSRDRGRTTVRRVRQRGPLAVQKPFNQPNGECQVYLLHPPGGIVGGDTLATTVRATRDASGLVTTPASSKVYRSTNAVSTVTQRLEVSAGARLAWLPQDTILFGGSKYAMNTEIDLNPSASFCGWEITSLGRPLSGDGFDVGAFDQRMQVTVGGAVRLREHLAWSDDRTILDAAWGLAGRRVLATWLTYPADADLVNAVRECLPDGFAATLLQDLLLVRGLADDAHLVRQTLATAWHSIHMQAFGVSACMPRIWLT
jgi:urease accessory protein